MARIRTIKPEHTLKKKIGYLSDRAYRLWVALICNADDEGRGDLDADEFRAKAYGFQPKVTERHVSEALAEVFAAKLAYQYAVNGKLYYQMHQWEEHQKIQHPGVSKIPPCPEVESNNNAENGQKEAIHEDSGAFTNPHEASLLIKDQGSRIKDQGIYKKIISENPHEDSPTVSKKFSLGLTRFIEAHPYGKQYKEEAAKVWQKNKLEPLADEIVEAVEQQKTWPDLAREDFQFFIRPARYLRERHWKDQQRAVSARASPHPHNGSSASGVAQRMLRKAQEEERGH